MKIGTFAEVLPSLKERFRKNIIANRSVMIALWCDLALIVGTICFYLVVRVSLASMADQMKTHPHQPIDHFSSFYGLVFYHF